jgi:hypothetical protein
MNRNKTVEGCRSVGANGRQQLAALAGLFLLGLVVTHAAASSWQDEFAKMPLPQKVSELNETNCVNVMLPALQRNPAVKALIFMPGATDEFYFFHRARATLTNQAPTLLDAVCALTNQTLIRATFRAPFLILHTAEDPIEPIGIIEDLPTADRLKQGKFAKHVVYNDEGWDSIHPFLSFYLNVKTLPGVRSHDTYHFFRHSFAAYDLTCWEAMEAVAMAGKTRFTVQKKKVIFQGDTRFIAKPPTPPNFLMPTPNKKG